MFIEYENEAVQDVFSDLRLMNKTMGQDRARGIKKRLDQLKAASNFGVYLSTGLGKPHPLSENLKGYYGITITGNVRLVVRPKAESLEPEVLQECDTVVVKGVTDYHGRKNEWIIP